MRLSSTLTIWIDLKGVAKKLGRGCRNKVVLEVSVLSVSRTDRGMVAHLQDNRQFG